jgi:rod shape-determining protein MreC
MIRLSIPARQALGRLALPLLFAGAFALLLLGKADALLAERARVAIADALAPLYGLVSHPLARVRADLAEMAHLFSLASENAALREENAHLRQWQSVALALEAENKTLRANLHWIPDPDAAYVTARVVADAGGVYARAVLVAVGSHHAIEKGQIALDDQGLVGRVTEIGARSARILLITDINSRIPVTLERSRARAILAGTNGEMPRLLFWPQETPPEEGEPVVTSAEANAFPAGLPIGTVHYVGASPMVVPAAHLTRLDIVRVFDTKRASVAPPEATARVSRPAPPGVVPHEW